MVKRDHITITYYDIKYPYYKEPGYDYYQVVKLKTRKYKKPLKQLSKEYWDKYWDEKYYITGYWYHLSKPSRLPTMPKLKRDTCIPRGTFPQLNQCPKHWNKLMHIRPNRRAWKRYCQKSTVYIKDVPMWFQLKHIHPSLGMPYPSGKKHVYYY